MKIEDRREAARSESRARQQVALVTDLASGAQDLFT